MEKLRFIQVGTGGFGAYWCEMVLPRVASFAECVAAVDVNPEALENARKFLGLGSDCLYSDVRKALSEHKVDFITVVVPPEHRPAIIDLAVEFGVDVVCEKPVAASMDDACSIYKKMKDAGLRLMVTMSHHMECEKQTVQRLVQSGDYGKPNYLVSRLNIKRGRYSGRRERPVEEMISGGVIHNLDTLRGMAGSNAKTVFAQCWRFEAGDGTYGGNCLISMEMENGVRCVAEQSMAVATSLDGWSREYFRAECANATIECHGPETIRIRSDLGYPYPTDAYMMPPEQPYWDHSLLLRHYYEWNKEGILPPTNIEDNLHCSAMTFAAIESAVTGKVVDVQAFYRKHMEKYQ